MEAPEREEEWKKWLKDIKQDMAKDLLEPTASLPFVFEEQFRLYRCCPDSQNNPGQWILQHRNGVMLLGISACHPLIQQIGKIRIHGRSVHVSVVYPKALASKVVTGKRKRGAFQLQPSQTICSVSISGVELGRSQRLVHSDDSEGVPERFVFQGCAFGDLIECNAALGTTLVNLKDRPTPREESHLWMAICLARSKAQLTKSIENSAEVPYAMP